MKYVYQGPVPVPDEAGELLHPGDVREFDEAPDCPPWELVDERGGIEVEADPADVPEPPAPAVPDMARADLTLPAIPKGM